MCFLTPSNYSRLTVSNCNNCIRSSGFLPEKCISNMGDFAGKVCPITQSQKMNMNLFVQDHGFFDFQPAWARLRFRQSSGKPKKAACTVPLNVEKHNLAKLTCKPNLKAANTRISWVEAQMGSSPLSPAAPALPTYQEASAKNTCQSQCLEHINLPGQCL